MIPEISDTRKTSSHHPEKQFARQAREHVLMDAQDDIHHILMRRLLAEHLGCARIDCHPMKLAGRGNRGRGHCDRDQRLRLLQIGKQSELAGIALPCDLNHPIERCTRCAGRQLLRNDLLFKEFVDLMMENQRQAGRAQHQQEHHADERSPCVNARPQPDRLRSHRRATNDS
jgi:hypothetical protein